VNLIETLEQEEIARLGKVIPSFCARRHRSGQRETWLRESASASGFEVS